MLSNRSPVRLVRVAAVLALSFGAQASPRGRQIVLGGLFPVTGGWSSLGKAGVAAMEIAARIRARVL